MLELDDESKIIKKTIISD